MDLGEVGCKGVDWIQVTEDRNQWRDLMNTVIYILIS